MLKRKWLFCLICLIVSGLFWLTSCHEQETAEEELQVTDNNGSEEESSSENIVAKEEKEEQLREEQLRKEVIESLSGLHEAKEDKGFFWPYYLNIPDNIEVGQAVNILVLPTSSPQQSDSLEYHKEYAEEVNNRLGNYFGQELKAITITPVLPRFKEHPYSDNIKYGWSDPQRLEEPTIKREEGQFYQFDLQTLSMIEDAREQFQEMGITTYEEFYMYGFSNGGVFTNRMLLLHPEKIMAAAFGGTGFPAVPVCSWNDIDLPYPTGIGGLEEITEKEFDQDEFNSTPVFAFRGSLDENDFYEFSRPPYVVAFGETPLERNKAAKEIYESVGSNVEFRFYDVEHEVSRLMYSDILDFFKKHMR